MLRNTANRKKIEKNVMFFADMKSISTLASSKETEMDTFVTYRLKNQKNKGYKGLYSKLFKMLNGGSIFSECYDEKHWFEGDDMIIVCSWGLEVEMPKGITEYVYTEDSEVSIEEVREILKEYE